MKILKITNNMLKPNSNSLNTFIVKFASPCNLNCSYCYEYNTGDDSWKSKPKYFSLENAITLNKRLKEYLKFTDHNYLNIIGHGGEPLLMGPEKLDILFENLISGIEDKIKLGIQTNAVLVNEKIITVLKKYNVRCGVSLDGNKEHNKHRVNHAGKSTYDEVLAGYTLLSNNNLVSGILCVTDFNNDPIEVVDSLCMLNPQPTQIDFLHPFVNHDHPKGITKLGLEYQNWVIKAFDYYMDNAKYHHIKIRLFESALFSTLSGKSNSDWFGGPFGKYLVIETDGNYDILDHLKSIGSYGKNFSNLNMNLNTNTLISAYNKIWEVLDLINMKQIPDLCSVCTHVKACSGGYYPTRYSSVNNSLNNPSVYCNGLFAFFNHLKFKYASK
jgi:uncharacterized protein